MKRDVLWCASALLLIWAAVQAGAWLEAHVERPAAARHHGVQP